MYCIFPSSLHIQSILHHSIPKKCQHSNICSRVVGVQASSSLPSVKTPASWKTPFKQHVPCVHPSTISSKLRSVPIAFYSTGLLHAMNQLLRRSWKKLATTLLSSSKFDSISYPLGTNNPGKKRTTA